MGIVSPNGKEGGEKCVKRLTETQMSPMVNCNLKS